MLEELHIKNVGPAPEMEMNLTERLNLITGDNGLGKSFLLDVAWWVLTRTWAREKIMPDLPPSNPEISYRYRAKSEVVTHVSTFDRQNEQWTLRQSRSTVPGLVLYAQVDGGFSVWDPARNYWKKDTPDRPPLYSFDAKDIWDGTDLCEGLIRDWASWQREGSTAYDQLTSVLKVLSPSPNEIIEPGELRKVYLDDPKRYPTLKMPYNQDVAVIHASAGIRRIIAIAYLLVWAWQEHVAACQLRGETPTKRIIFLIDEAEAHLHPQWQRRIIPSLLEVMDAITGEHNVNVQLIATTHSPLVLASLETLFDSDKDSWFDMDLVPDKRVISLEKKTYTRRGDFSNWLTSDAFDLKEARSLEAEEAITAALKVLREKSPGYEEMHRINQQLQNSLSDIDRFWIRWTEFYNSHVVVTK